MDEASCPCGPESAELYLFSFKHIYTYLWPLCNISVVQNLRFSRIKDNTKRAIFTTQPYRLEGYCQSHDGWADGWMGG